MSSLIELAAQRLEQLRGTGLPAPPEMPDRAATPPAEPARAATPAKPSPVADAGPSVSRRVELDMQVLKASGVVTPDDARSTLAEQYRVIKRPLLRNAQTLRTEAERHGNLIMVTSALPGEGKSFTAANLAMSIAAELDHTVLLVDADVARPSCFRMLGLQPGPGLLDVLEHKIDLPNAILRTNVDKLSLLPSGSPLPHATELLASDAMSELLDEIATRYADRIVIFDSPPLLLTTEARVLASHMGQIVFVVRADQTLQSTVQQALATIENCPVKMLLLNQARVDTAGGYSPGYGYGYGYGDSGASGAPAGAAPRS